MQRLKTIVLVVLITLVAIVMVQNANPVTFKFLNWRYEVSQLLLVVIVFVLGWLTGFIAAKTGRRKSDDDAIAPPR